MKSIWLASFATLLAASAANAEQTYEYPADDPFFTISFPDKWTIEGDDESLSAAPKDESVAVELIALAAEDFEAALDEAAAAIEDGFDNVSYDDPQEGKVNEMDVLLINAEGAVDGQKLHISICLFAPEGAETIFMMFFFAPPDAFEAHGEELNGILQSIKGA